MLGSARESAGAACSGGRGEGASLGALKAEGDISFVGIKTSVKNYLGLNSYRIILIPLFRKYFYISFEGLFFGEEGKTGQLTAAQLEGNGVFF
jgi:hypothetical protein